MIALSIFIQIFPTDFGNQSLVSNFKQYFPSWNGPFQLQTFQLIFFFCKTIEVLKNAFQSMYEDDGNFGEDYSNQYGYIGDPFTQNNDADENYIY